MFLLVNLQDLQNLVKYPLFLLPPCLLLEDILNLPCQQWKSQCDRLLSAFYKNHENIKRNVHNSWFCIAFISFEGTVYVKIHYRIVLSSSR